MKTFRKIMSVARKIGAILFFVELVVEVVELVNSRVEDKFGNIIEAKIIEDGTE